MLINPLDMRGPQFLIFYFILGVITLLLIRYRMSQQGSNRTMPKLNLTDPYEIAYLRGSENEALRIAIISLIDRGLLEVSGIMLKTKIQNAMDNVRRPIEKAILKKFLVEGSAYDIYKDQNLQSACFEYRRSLQHSQLLASDDVFASRRPLLFLGLFILGGTASTKIFVALQRGHHNVMFLIVMAIGFTFFLIKIYVRPRTSLGDSALTDLRILFKGLKKRNITIRRGGQTNEASLLAAVFGVSALYPGNFPFIENIFPKAQANSSCGATGCGSSCGSSCGGGGGGGCGGCGGD